MFGFLDKMAEIFLNTGIDQLIKNKEFNRLREAINEKIEREIRFNQELLKEIVRRKTPDNLALVSRMTEALQTTAFDSIIESSIPLGAIFDNKDICEDAWKDFWDNYPYPSLNFFNWAKGISNETLLIERIYHRIKIIKVFSNLEISKGHQSLKYVMFLISAMPSMNSRKS
jgi:hypothetical protein